MTKAYLLELGSPKIATATLLVSYLTIVPAIIKLKRIYPDVHREYVVPGGHRGFNILGAIVFFYVVVGTVGSLFPGTLEGLFGIDYSFDDNWGVSRASFEVFTLGTLTVVILIGVAGYLGASGVRNGFVTDDNND